MSSEGSGIITSLKLVSPLFFVTYVKNDIQLGELSERLLPSIIHQNAVVHLPQP